jgi:hypothetical protein
LSFFHAFPVEVFNAGEYRRRMYNGHKDAEWFNPSNAETSQMRDTCNDAAVADMEQFLTTHDNAVVIFDSVNSTFDRRFAVLNRMHACGAKVLFIEVQNTSEFELQDNYRDVAKNCPDYVGIGREESVRARSCRCPAAALPPHSLSLAHYCSVSAFHACRSLTTRSAWNIT